MPSCAPPRFVSFLTLGESTFSVRAWKAFQFQAVPSRRRKWRNRCATACRSKGLFAGQEWRVSTAPFRLEAALGKELESLGRVLLQFYRAVNLLYRKSVEGKQPEWVARWLELGKPPELVQLQRSATLKNDVPRVIRPIC